MKRKELRRELRELHPDTVRAFAETGRTETLRELARAELWRRGLDG